MDAEPTRQSGELARGLADSLRGVLGPVTVEGLERLTGGASRETWRFDAVDGSGGRHPLVLRRDPPGRPGQPGGMAREAALIRAAGEAGLAVPEVLVSAEAGSHLGTAGIVMRRVEGETLARRILRDDEFARARANLTGQCARFLAGLHRIDPDGVPGLPTPDPLASYRAALDALGQPSPTFEWALRWLEANRPPPGRKAVVHGDFRLGNLVVGPDGLRAVLDWELAHAGDPLEDLGWLCVKAWRFGGELPVGGFGTRELLVSAYRAAGGVPVNRDELHWWEVFNTLKWGVVCMSQAAVHLGGAVRSVELAAIGRRVCEQEWDLFLLLHPDLTERARPTPATRPPAGADLHGRPTATELLEAVGEYLRGDVMGSTSGRLAFHGRVAANVVDMVARELAVGSEQAERRAADLGRLGVDDEAGLAAAIRDGRLDGDREKVAEVLVAGVVDKLAVANPRYLAAGGA